MKKIICPDCGKIKEYCVAKQVKRTLYFDANGNPCGTPEDQCVYSWNVKKCPKCGNEVKIIDVVEDES